MSRGAARLTSRRADGTALLATVRAQSVELAMRTL